MISIDKIFREAQNIPTFESNAMMLGPERRLQRDPSTTDALSSTLQSSVVAGRWGIGVQLSVSIIDKSSSDAMRKIRFGEKN